MLTVVGRLISVKLSFPSAALEEHEPGGGTVEALSLGGRGFAVPAALHAKTRGNQLCLISNL